MLINLVDSAGEHSFIITVIPKALESELGILAMKTIADGRFFRKKNVRGKIKWKTGNPVISSYLTLEEALYYTGN